MSTSGKIQWMRNFAVVVQKVPVIFVPSVVRVVVCVSAVRVGVPVRVVWKVDHPLSDSFFSRPSRGVSSGSGRDLAVQGVTEEIFAIPPQMNMGQLKSLTRVSMCVEGILSVALVDTGSCANIISSQRFQEMQQLQCCDRDSFSVEPFERVLYSANNKAIPMSGIVSLNLEVGPPQAQKYSLLAVKLQCV